MAYFYYTKRPTGYVGLVLQRPEVHNALNAEFISDLTAAFLMLGADEGVRLICIMAEGDSFCAGADLNWMKEAAKQTESENKADAIALARLFDAINTCPKPVIALVNGPAYGGGIGIIACCDIVLATPSARFGLTEVRLGLIPATISPYVVAKIGVSHARRLMLTGERFDAATAYRIGLVHEIADDPAEAAIPFIQALLANGPQAISDTKSLIADIVGRKIDDDLRAMTAERIAARRASDEGREGISAFLDKRKPGWCDNV